MWHGGIGPKGSAVFKLALALARDGVDGTEAVDRLRRTAKGARRLCSVRDFLTESQAPGSMTAGSPTYMQAMLLVDAALGQVPAPQPSPAAMQEGALERRLTSLPLAEAFALLCEHSPSLRALDDGIRDGSIKVNLTLPPAAMRTFAKRNIQTAEQAVAGGIEERSLRLAGLRQQVEQIVGLGVSDADPLVRTPAALTIAMRHLRPLVDPGG
jgi:hypothetical protein